MRIAFPLVTVLPLFGATCDRDSGPHFGQHAQAWSGAAAVFGQHEWLVTATALYYPGRAMVVEGIVTGGPSGQDITFEVILEHPLNSTATVLPLATWSDPQLGGVGAALVRDPRVRWPKALARNKVVIQIHTEN